MDQYASAVVCAPNVPPHPHQQALPKCITQATLPGLETAPTLRAMAAAFVAKLKTMLSSLVAP